MKIDVNNIVLDKNSIFHCIGSGRLDLALRTDYQKSLRKIQKDLKFQYIRAHGIFSKDMGIYREYQQNGVSKTIYNFTYLDQIFDFFLSIDIRPLLELGFMPEEIASGEQTIFWWKGNVTPPKEYDSWASLVKATLNHLINRYGKEEVRKWPIEVWNEPNLNNFWKNADQNEYFKLYALTAQAIKDVDPNLMVGGPVICGGTDYWLKDFLQFCLKNELPLDFLSRHAYSSGPANYHGLWCEQEIMPVKALLDDFKTGKQALHDFYNRDLPVYVSEFNTSYTPDNPVHDSAFNAAYLAPVLSKGSDLVDSFSYWTFSDMFEEKGIPTSFLHGGFGLLTYYQIKKPTYYIYEFFAQITSSLLFKDDNVHVAIGKHSEIVIIAWNPTNKDKKINLDLEGIMAKRFFCKETTVNEEYGNVDNAWRKMGMPRFPTTYELDQLRQLSQPKYSCRTVDTNDDCLEVELSLKENQITMLQLNAGSDDYKTY